MIISLRAFSQTQRYEKSGGDGIFTLIPLGKIYAPDDKNNTYDLLVGYRLSQDQIREKCSENRDKV